MVRRNPIEKSHYISNEFTHFIRSTFRFNDPEYQKEFIKQLEEQKLYKGPFVHATLPFASGRSIRELIDDGKANCLFEKFKNINLDRKLYWHQ